MIHILQLLVLASFAIEAESQQWPLNKCAFFCQNDGLCNQYGICSCEAGWLGVDCSIPLYNSPIEYSPFLTRMYSYFNKDYTYWSVSNGTITTHAQTGTVLLSANTAFYTKKIVAALDYVLTVTMRIVTDSSQNGVMFIIAPSAAFSTTSPSYGVNWASFLGLAIRFSRVCNGITILKRGDTDAALGSPTCTGVAFQSLNTTLLAEYQSTFRFEMAVRSGTIYSINICTISNCISPFADDDLGVLVGSLYNLEVKNTYFGIGAGIGSTVNVFEVRVKETVYYPKDWSLLYPDFQTGWTVTKVCNNACQGNIATAIRLTPDTSNNQGVIWSNTPLNVVNNFVVKAIVDISSSNGKQIKGVGFYLMTTSSRKPDLGTFAVDSSHLTGLAVMCSPRNAVICASFATSGSGTIDPQCGGSYIGKNSSVNDLMTRLQIYMSLQTTTTTFLTFYVYTKYNKMWNVVNRYNLGVDIAAMPALYFGIAAYGDSDYSAVDVLDIKTYTPNDKPVMEYCKFRGYSKNITCALCQAGWTGSDCSQPICSPSCSSNARCVSPNSCACKSGWGNLPNCDIPKCIYGCPLHAECTAPYTCKCISGWSGRDCSVSTSITRTASSALSDAVPPLSLPFSTPGSITSYWNLYQPAAVSAIYGGVLANGALRLAPSSSSNRGGIWTKTAVNRVTLVIDGTVEIGQTGVSGDGFSIALVPFSTGTSNSTTYTSGTEYMIKWNQTNQFLGTAANFQPGRGQICLPTTVVLTNVDYKAGAYCNAVLSTYFRRKFQFTMRVLVVGGFTTVDVTICNADLCYPNLVSNSPLASVPLAGLFLGISAENNPTTYDSFDVYEIATKDLVTCLMPCLLPNQACASDGSCTCQDGWTGSDCDQPSCPNAPATNANCTAPFTWSCQPNWGGIDCSSAMCSSDAPYGVCTAPNNLTCIAGTTCSAVIGVPSYVATSLPISFFMNAASLTSNFILVPSSVPLSSVIFNSGSVPYLQLANSQTQFNGALIGSTPIPDHSNIAINVTIEAKKTIITGCYYAIYVLRTESLDITATGGENAVKWDPFLGLGVMFIVNTGKICIVYKYYPLYDESRCHLTSAATFNLMQKVRIGIVTIDNRITVDVCTVFGCESAFSNVIFTPSQTTEPIGTRWTSMRAAIIGYTLKNQPEAINLFEFATARIPYCTSPCANGGTCIANDVCSCAPGYGGPNCTYICAPGQCQNNGTCGGFYTCSCTGNWTGTNCTVPACNPTCQNGGTCTSPNVCNCTANYTGSVCTTPLCPLTPCVNGNCTAPNKCTCQTGYTGSKCDTPICSPACQNGGNCTAPSTCTCAAGYTSAYCTTAICPQGCPIGNGNCLTPGVCTCLAGWTGSNCTTFFCNQTCGNGNCTGPNTCTCNSGWTGASCQTPICSSGCLHGGNCTAPGLCACATGWTGSQCSSAVCNNPCSANGNCTAPNTCTCASGYTDSTCSTSTCSPACVNGNCTGPNICTCAAGWTGSTCATAVCNEGCGNGTCTGPEICTCNSGWSGSNCSTPICNQTCTNGGSCTAPNICTCTSGWMGLNCSQPYCSGGCGNGVCTSPSTCTCNSGWSNSTCSTPICSSGCPNGGTCIAPETCSCQSGWTGVNCTQSALICSPSCANGGNCTSPNVCTCPSGWSGLTCQIPICNGGCSNNGNCTSPNVCTCGMGWNGTNCDIPTCSPPCSSNGNCTAPNICTCAAGWSNTTCDQSISICPSGCVSGTCIGPGNCQCNAGWTGINCSTAICNSSCLNGGNCIAPGVCSCVAGWTGQTCSQAICSPGCVNGGNCSSPNNCMCPAGYNGTACQLAICNVPCLNGGTCSTPNNCTCPTGYNGTNCQFAICNTPCVNGGTCSAPNTCTCQFGYTGAVCGNPICGTGCVNGGTCSSPNNCTCQIGYNGTLCQYAICTNPCLNGGTCNVPETCTCPTGYNGTVCESPICNQGCANGGTCIGPGICSCTANWTGINCQTPNCIPPCQNGGTCSSPSRCVCPSGVNGTACEFAWCSTPCQNGGTCIGNDVCKCVSGYSGLLCETLMSGLSALGSIFNLSDAAFISQLESVKNAITSVQDGTIQPKTNLSMQEIKAIFNDVTSPSKVINLVQDIVNNPFFDPPFEIFSDEQLETQAEVLSTLNQVTKRMLGLAATLNVSQMTSLTDVLSKAADNAAILAVRGALAVQSAIIKSDRLESKPKLACTPLITEKERKTMKEGSTLAKLETLSSNFADFIDGLITALLWTPLKVDETKIITGDFYGVTIRKILIGNLPRLSLYSSLGGVDFPALDANTGDFLAYHDYPSPTWPKLTRNTHVLIVLMTYVSNVMNASSPYNFPTVTVRLFTTLRLELSWASSTPLHIISRPPENYRNQYATEKAQSQCDPHTVQCDLTTSADKLGALATYPIPTNAGDFLLSLSGDLELAYDIFIALNMKPTLTAYSWIVHVENTKATPSLNSTLPPLKISYSSTGQIRIIISQSAISIASGQPVTRVIDATPPFIIYALVKRRLSSFSVVDDLPQAACQMLACEGFNLRINRIEPTSFYRKKRQSSDYTIQDLDLESNSSELALSFKAQAFGTFTSDLLVVPNTIEFEYVIDNFENLVSNNWIVLATMATVIALFSIMIYPMFLYDRKDLKEWAFMPIISNSQHETMRYLISVHTIKCENQHLIPKVEIRLHGDVTNTEWRCLDDGIRKNFVSNRPSNFILTTYHSLGMLEQLDISVRSEKKPVGSCGELALDIDKVIIVDVSTGRKYIFLCQSKLDTLKTKVFKLTPEDELRRFDYLLPANSRVLLRDSHLWISIFRRPLASNWTRCERLACITVALFFAMLTNAMFYGKEGASPRLGANIGGLFRFSWFTFWTSFVSCGIAIPPICIIASIFHFVKRRSAEKCEWETSFTIQVAECADENDDKSSDLSKRAGKWKRNFSLPYWCLYIAWTLVGISICTSALIIVFYSLQWGQEKSLQWLSGLILAIIQDMIFIQTAKVFVVAIFHAGRLSLPDDGVDLGRVTFPKDNTFKKVSLFGKLRVIATGIGHHTLYILAFALVIGATTNEYAFPQVKALKPHLFVDGYKTLTDGIPDYKVIFDHLLFRIIPNFLNGNQVKYGLKFPDADFYDIPNHDVVLIGPIRVRQIRAGLAPCPVQTSVVQQITDRFSVPLTNNTRCFKVNPGIDVFGDAMERRNFNGSWNSPVTWLDTTNISAFHQAWLYRQLDGPSYSGEYGYYEPNGYYIDLPNKLKTAVRVVAQLRMMRWLDGNTTAVFVDFNLYNPQTNVFSVIKIVFESLTTGGMIYQVRRYPLKLYQYSGPNALFTIVIQSLWIAVLISQIVKMIYQIRKEGLAKFRKNQWNLLNMANLVVGAMIVGLFLARIYVTMSSVDRLHNYPEEFTSLDQLSIWEELMFDLYGLGFFLAMMAFFQYLESNKYWALFLGTLSKGKEDIVSYCAFFVMMTAFFAGYFYCTVGDSMAAFSSYKTAMLSLLQRIVGSAQLTKLGFPDKLSMIWSMIYSGLMLSCGTQVFVALLNKTYGRVSKNIEKETDWDSELSKYMGDEFSRITTLRDKENEQNNCDEFLDDKMKIGKGANKRVEEKTFQKFDAMLQRFSKIVEKFGLDEDTLFQEKPPIYERAHKKETSSKATAPEFSNSIYLPFKLRNEDSGFEFTANQKEATLKQQSGPESAIDISSQGSSVQPRQLTEAKKKDAEDKVTSLFDLHVTDEPDVTSTDLHSVSTGGVPENKREGSKSAGARKRSDGEVKVADDVALKAAADVRDSYRSYFNGEAPNKGAATFEMSLAESSTVAVARTHQHVAVTRSSSLQRRASANTHEKQLRPIHREDVA